MATTVARLQAILSANTRDFDRAMSRSETRMQRVGNAAKVGLAIGVGVGIKVMNDSVRAAIDAERSEARLERAFKNVGVALAPHNKALEDASKAAINLGFDDEDLKDSIGSLIVATGNYKDAQADANIAMDIARFKGTSLEAATKTLTMAMGGSQRAIKQLGLSVEPVTANYDKLKAQFGSNLTASEKARLATAKLQDKQATAAQVIDLVSKKVRGQADAYAQTAEGKMAVFSAKTEELKEQLGKGLLPALVKVIDATNRFASALQGAYDWMGKLGANKSGLELMKELGKVVPTKPLHQMADALQAVWGWLNKIIDAFKWLIDNAKKIGGVFSGIAGVAGKLPGIGDVDPNRFKSFLGGFGTGPKSINPRLYDELSGARAFGLTLTSGYRPGAVTRHGTPSDHGVFPSKAIDVAGPPNRMAAFFRWLIGQTDVKQAFYDPLGSIFGGMLSSYREGGHSDHVHVATYDQGGFLRPGWNLAYNGLGRPEPVGAMGVGPITLEIDGQRFFTWFLNEKQKRDRRGDRF